MSIIIFMNVLKQKINIYIIFFCNIDIINSFIFEFNITKLFEYVNENTFKNKSKYFVHKRLFVVQMKIEK